jgi:hypothetical protein
MNNPAKTLTQLYNEHTGKVSDKWTRYLAEYDLLLSPWRDRPIRLLEIGVQNGGGLEIWAEYFKNASRFVGCDIDPNCAQLQFSDPRISFVLGDVNTDSTQEEILPLLPEFDLLIDDGSHRSSDIVKSFLRYFPYVVDGGLYVVEDLHASYWQEFEGGLFDPFSAISFFKRLVDIINSEHWGTVRSPAGILAGFLEKYGLDVNNEILQHIHSIKFINSLCIIQKSSPADNKLGIRIIAGRQSNIYPIIKELDKSFLIPPAQSSNIWSNRPHPPEEDVPSLEAAIRSLQEQLVLQKQGFEEKLVLQEQGFEEQLVCQKQGFVEKLGEKDQSIRELAQQLADKSQQLTALDARRSDLENEVVLYALSTSWKITRPLRKIMKKLRGEK